VAQQGEKILLMPLHLRGDGVSVPLLGNRDVAAKMMEARASGQRHCGNQIMK